VNNNGNIYGELNCFLRGCKEMKSKMLMKTKSGEREQERYKNRSSKRIPTILKLNYGNYCGKKKSFSYRKVNVEAMSRRINERRNLA
jgi:hypothetical protein